MLDTPESAHPRNHRWTLLRDVLVFQLKMALDNLRDFALMPIALVSALVDLLFASRRDDALFYKVLRWGFRSEQIIDVYSAIEDHTANEPALNPNYTIDAVVARLERVVVRECEKGGSAASVKAAMDRVIDQVHAETRPARDKATEIAVRAAEKVRGQFERPPE